MTLSFEETVREIAIANPAAIQVFEKLGIDYCCGGNLSLATACAHANVSLDRLAGALQTCQQSPEPVALPVASNAARLGEITRHIVARHHEFVRRESPRIQALLVKVCGKHGRTHVELSQVSALFATLDQELAAHMMKEERIPFPYIESLDGTTARESCFGSVESPIAVMIADHENAGAILSKIRALTDGYTVPEGACPTFHGLFAALQEFERDLHRHVHLENNILFPRAISAERELRGAPVSAN